MEPGMSKENLDDHWKNKLEDVSSLSGETFTDKNATWEKLHSRLCQKPPGIRAVWYWAAAACLLLAVIIPAIMFNKKQNSLVENIPTQILTKEITVPEISPSKENVVANISPSLIIKKKYIKPYIQTKEKKSGANNIVNKEETVLANLNDQKDIQQIQQELPISLPLIINTPVEAPVAIAPVKKKLKVVHINELSEPGEKTLNTARYYERRSLKLKFNNHTVYTNSSLPMDYTGFNILKLKNAPSN